MALRLSAMSMVSRMMTAVAGWNVCGSSHEQISPMPATAASRSMIMFLAQQLGMQTGMRKRGFIHSRFQLSAVHTW